MVRYPGTHPISKTSTRIVVLLPVANTTKYIQAYMQICCQYSLFILLFIIIVLTLGFSGGDWKKPVFFKVRVYCSTLKRSVCIDQYLVRTSMMLQMLLVCNIKSLALCTHNKTTYTVNQKCTNMCKSVNFWFFTNHDVAHLQVLNP